MKYDLHQLIEVKSLQKLLDNFYKVTGTSTAILGLDGDIITASGWQPICTEYHRKHPETSKKCVESDTAIANSIKEGKKYNFYRCMNGMIDVAMPVYLRGQHVCNLFIGQFLDKEPNLDFFRDQAAKYGFPEEEYLNALSKVQIITEEEAQVKLEFLEELAKMIGEMGLNRLESLEVKEELEDRVLSRTKALKDSQVATLNIMQDVEESRRKTEKLLEDLKLINKELEMFAYVASHDLQEPLRKVSSYTELLAKRYSENFDERASKYMNYIIDGAHRMQQLIEDLLRFSRVDTRSNKFEKTDTNELFKNVLSILEIEIIHKEAKIVSDNLPVIIADGAQIRQVFQNLISNALKFNGKRRPEIIISCEDKKNSWQFAIKDNGIGIEEKYREKIFVIFQRLHSHEEYKGTGIGLAICKKVIARHGGKIWLESTSGEGSTFFFSIPKKPSKR